MMDNISANRKRKREDDEAKEEFIRRRIQEHLETETRLISTSAAIGSQRPASELLFRSPDFGQFGGSEALPRHRVDISNVMQRSPTRRGMTSTLLNSSLASHGSGASLAESLFPNAGILARSLQDPSLAVTGTRTPPSSLLASAPAFLPSYEHTLRNLTATSTTPSLFGGLQGIHTNQITNQLQPMHSLRQLSAQHRLQTAVAQRQYAEETLRRASAASALLPNQLAAAAAIPNESFAPRPASFPFRQQMSSGSLCPSSTSVMPHEARKPREPVALYLECDNDSLTPYQCLARQQIQLFEATPTDVESATKGRNRTVVLGQVGIRCRHCAHLPLRERARGSTYYPSKLNGIYQAAQNMSNSHMVQYCQEVPKDIREELKSLGNKKSSAGGGKNYWSGGAKILGVVEDDHGLRFRG